ncbi:MAG: Spy/CpxP family protein refolding chaperone [Methylococcales bacterium]|nr:Spy/CpxP family protein refolding chaperone [Methylococcales bacterium]
MRKILLLLVLFPAISLANPPMPDEPPCGEMHRFNHHGMEGENGHLPRFLQGIDLTDTQQTEIKALMKSMHDEFKAKHEETKKIHQEIRNLSFSDDYTDAKAEALNEKANAMHKELGLKKSRLNNSIYKLLNNDQKQKLKTNLTQSEGRFF